MLNLIKSFVMTFVSIVVTLISFIRLPLVVGAIVGVTIMAFAGEASAASAATSQPTFISLSFSETFAVVLIALALVGAIILFVKESN